MENQYRRSVVKITSRVFRAADRQGLDLRALSEKSGVAYSTVWKLANGWTKYPLYRTIFKLASVVGLEVKLVVARRTAGV